jgi:uncharacterized protein YggE
MKKKYWVISGLLLIMIAALLSGCSGSSEKIISSQQEGIWVTGMGKVAAMPDLATLSLGIEAQEATVAQAQTQASQVMNEVISALESQGITEEDIQTQSFSIQQVTRYNPDTQQETVIGYKVTNVVTVKIRALERVGMVIDAVAEAGGDLTRINNISFSIEDPSTYYDEARITALEDAKDKAEKISTLAGINLGKPTYISEATQVPGPIRLSLNETTPVAAPTETPISPGEIEVTLTIQVAYEIMK